MKQTYINTHSYRNDNNCELQPTKTNNYKQIKHKITFIAFAFFVSILFVYQNSYAHCEIPCGIYEDSLRISLINEHITTIEKSMNMINELSKQTNPNYNQLVRWITNKEEHANKIQEIVSQYFLHQRVIITDSSDKEKYNKYIKQLTSLHAIAVFSMKAKQSTDLTVIENLKKSVGEFVLVYFGGHKH
jgi:nickel superoxide dismutase